MTILFRPQGAFGWFSYTTSRDTILLRELDAQIAATMNQVAYGRMSRVDWEKTCKAHRIAFDEWIKFADLQTCEEIDSAAKKPDDV